MFSMIDVYKRQVDSTVEYAFLEHCLREDLNETARRVMAVLRPVKLVITNYPEGQSEQLTVENNPLRPEDGTREVTFSREEMCIRDSSRPLFIIVAESMVIFWPMVQLG